jgi:hypothetical protein
MKIVEWQLERVTQCVSTWYASHIFLIRFSLILVGFCFLQLPFLLADAESGLGWSRGPYTDEGLYTAQIRNALITGHLDLAESDAVIKQPLFAAAAWLVLSTFGDSMASFRLAVIVFSGAMLAIFASGPGKFARVVRIAVLFGFLSYFPFHYGHLAMAEVPCSITIVAGLYFIHKRLSGSGWWTVPVSGFLLFVTYAAKIQFAYVALIPPFAFFLAMVLRWTSSGAPLDKRLWLDVILSLAIAAFFAVLYFVVWVRPNLELFSFVLSTQATERTSSLTQIWGMVFRNILDLVSNYFIWSIFLLVLVGLGGAWQEWRTSAGDVSRRQAWIALIAPATAWLILEAHKLGLSYLPSRYLVSSFLAFAMVGATGLSMMRWQLWSGNPPSLQKIVAPLLAAAMVANAALYGYSLQGRTYVISNAQLELAETGRWQGKVVLGAWASSLFWGTGAITKPVWKNYFNDKDIIARNKPSGIVTEVDEEDSKGAFRGDGIEFPLSSHKVINIRNWKILIYEISAH